MAKEFLHLQNLSFSYDSQQIKIINNLDVTINKGWTGITGPNGCGKSTLFSLIAGRLNPTGGKVSFSGRLLIADQIPENPPDELFELFSRTDSEALRIIDILGLGYDWPYRWDTLSFGERKRSQIGSMAAASPDLMLLDEPTNHLDVDARKAVAEVMKIYSGTGLIISHDKDLLDKFCSRILFLPEQQLYSCGYTAACRERERIKLAAGREYQAARSELTRLKKEAARRRSLAAEQQRRRSKKNLDLKDHDGRAKLDLVRITGKDGTGGHLLRQLEGRLKQAEMCFGQKRVYKKSAAGVTLKGSRSRSNSLWNKDAGFISYYQGSEKGVVHPELVISPGARIVITGANGSGKSTLLNLIASQLPFKSWFLPQEFSPEMRSAMMEQFRLLGDGSAGRVVSSLCRLGSDPDLFLESESWSPGECKKIALSLAIESGSEEFQILLMDEPFNHLDLDSRELIKQAVSGFYGAVIAVSHDPSLILDWNAEKWMLEADARGSILLL